MKQWRILHGADIDPAKPINADIVLYPDNVTLDDFYSADKKRMLLSIAYCLKSLSCDHRFTNYCDVNCAVCNLSQVKRLCEEKSIEMRIETTNENLLDFLKKESARFDWIIGVACPYEIVKLAAFFWEEFKLRQIIFPLQGDFCVSAEDKEQKEKKEGGIKADLKFEALLEVLYHL